MIVDTPQIGIAPETASDDRPRIIRPREDDHVIQLKIVDHRGEEVSSLTWPKYLEWRKSKCRPYDYEFGPPKINKQIPGNLKPYSDGERIAFGGPSWERACEEIDQATHEFVGEVAELGQLFHDHGPTAYLGENRTKLIDEIGDILFCGAWVLDAWGVNPLAEADDLELLRVTDENELAQIAQALAGQPREAILASPRFLQMLQMVTLRFMLEASTYAGLLCNSFKKLRYQRREQKTEEQVARVCGVLLIVNQILVMANSSIEEALIVNQTKLDARFPGGYVAGQGGGNRTGKGV